jgi:hypothetical protein
MKRREFIFRSATVAIVPRTLLARADMRRDWETSGHRTPDRCVMNLRNLWKVQ